MAGKQGCDTGSRRPGRTRDRATPTEAALYNQCPGKLLEGPAKDIHKFQVKQITKCNRLIDSIFLIHFWVVGGETIDRFSLGRQ